MVEVNHPYFVECIFSCKLKDILFDLLVKKKDQKLQFSFTSLIIY